MEPRKVVCWITFLGDLGLCRHLLRPNRALSPFFNFNLFSLCPPEADDVHLYLVDCVGIDLKIGTYYCFDLLIFANPVQNRIAWRLVRHFEHASPEPDSYPLGSILVTLTATLSPAAKILSGEAPDSTRFGGCH